MEEKIELVLGRDGTLSRYYNLDTGVSILRISITVLVVIGSRIQFEYIIIAGSSDISLST